MPPKKKLCVKNNQQITQFLKPATSETTESSMSASVDDLSGQSDENLTVTDSSSKTPNVNAKILKFQPSWKSKYDWLEYDEKQNLMWCKMCKNLNLKNTLATGTDNFKTTTLTRHIESNDHKIAILAPKERENFRATVDNILSKEEQAITNCMKVVYWLAKEAIPLTKYSSLIGLLKELNTPDMDSLSVGEKVTYTSYNTATDMLSTISEQIDKEVTEKLIKSPAVTILTDESTDITVSHKLCITARVIEPSTMVPSTLFLKDLKISSATGEGIFNEIKGHLEERGIPVKNVTGLGTDGATVMTGQKKGLVGHFLRENPHLVHTHCSAHRVALCSEQAAENIPAMKYYQGIIEGLFYFFKKSPKRVEEVSAVQNLLNEPSIKYREVHQIRWLSFYQAVEAVYRTLDSLISYFASLTQDQKAIGFKRKLSQDFFIYMTYAMMDILQPIMKLSLFFQKKEVDIGLVQISVDACINDLQKMLDQDVTEPDKPTFTQQISTDVVDGIFKQHHTVSKSKYNYYSCRKSFIEAIIDNINKRFPNKTLMTSFSIMGMRPITFLSDGELDSWGNEYLDILIQHFSREKSHTYDKVTTRSDPVVDEEAVKTEWSLVKRIVKVQGYPRDSTTNLWTIIAEFHREQVPNLLKLASMALAHPVHTSDCERTFSSQNIITTPIRNRLNPDHCDMLMRVMIEGPSLQNFDFKKTLKDWKSKKSRAIFSFKK